MKNMKNHIINLFFIFTTFAACTSPEEILTSRNTLTGSEVLFCVDNNQGTKADEVTTSSISLFKATAFPASTSSSPYFTDLTFLASGSPRIFSSSSAPLWPESSLDFYAYSTGTEYVGYIGQVTRNSYNSFTVTPSTNGHNQVDLVYACARNMNVSSLSDGIAPLNFRHTESKVIVTIKNTSTSLKFVVYGWRLGYLDNSATFTHDGSSTFGQDGGKINPSCWSNNDSPSATNSYTIDMTGSPVSVSAAASTTVTLPGTMIVIPQVTTKATEYVSSSKEALVNGSYIGLKLKVMNATTDEILFGGDTGEWAIFPQDLAYIPGEQYVYSIDLITVNSRAFYEKNPVSDGKGLWNIMEQLPPPPTFAGLNITPAPLYYNGTSFEIKDTDWNHESYKSKAGKISGSYYFNFIELGQYFDSDGSSFSTSSGSIDNTNKISFNGYSDWRLPTWNEWSAILGTSRSGSTVNGTTSRHYAFVRLTGVTHAGSSTPFGLLLFPDGKTITGFTLSNMDNININTGITSAQLLQYLNQGCIFLPASGYYTLGNIGWNAYEFGVGYGVWWSSSSNDNNADYLFFTENVDPSAANGGKTRDYYPVRLVRTAY